MKETTRLIKIIIVQTTAILTSKLFDKAAKRIKKKSK